MKAYVSRILHDTSLLSLYSFDEDSDEDCETIENRIHVELIQKFACIFILGDSSCKEYRDIEVDASLGIQPVKSAKGREIEEQG